MIREEVIEEKRSHAIGTWISLSGIFGVLGLFLGGIIIENLGWSSVFLLCIPMAILAVFLGGKAETTTPRTGVIEWRMVISAFILLLFFTYSIIQNNAHSWRNQYELILFIITIICIPFFIVYQNRSAYPLIPLEIFRNKNIVGANLGTFFIYFSLNGIYIFLIYYLQICYDYSPSKSGWAMLPASLMVTFFASPFGKLSGGNKFRTILLLGSILATTSYFFLAFLDKKSEYLIHFLPFILLLGLGMSLFVSPITKSSLSIEARLSGLASGFNNFVARFSGIMAICILGSIMAQTKDQFVAYKVSMIIMGFSSLIGTIFLWLFCKPNEEFS